LCACPGLLHPGGPSTPSRLRRRGDSLPLVPRRRLPELSLSRLVTTAYTLAVYASPRRVTPTPRKTRFRWVASPCRVGFGPTGSTTKGFRFCLLHVPSSLPRLGLARDTCLCSLRPLCPPRAGAKAPAHPNRTLPCQATCKAAFPGTAGVSPAFPRHRAEGPAFLQEGGAVAPGLNTFLRRVSHRMRASTFRIDIS
jgi:hypothetical protein